MTGVDERTASPWRAFRIGPFTIRPREGQVSGPGGQRGIEPRAMQVLVHLARRGGAVASKEELVAAIWGTAVTDGAVSQAIYNLRRALGDDARHPAYIQTHHRNGYRLLVPAIPLGEEAAHPAEALARPFSAVFAGRHAELARLEAALARALAGRGEVALVTGDAGSGKTALLGELARRACAAHAQLAVAGGRGNAFAEVGSPFLPWREVLAVLTGDPDAGWSPGELAAAEITSRTAALAPAAAAALLRQGRHLLGTFVPAAELAGRLAPRDRDLRAGLAALAGAGALSGPPPTLAEQDIFEEYARVLCACARERPLLVIVDDTHWADEGSLGLLLHLARAVERAPILIVASFRPEDVAFGRRGGRHPLSEAVNELRRRYGDVEVSLDEAEGRRFLDDFLDASPNRLGADFRAALYARTRGHALFTVELLGTMEERGMLARGPDGHWGEAAAVDWETLPQRTEAVIAERIGRLPEALRRLAALASVEGEQFTAEVVALALDLPEAEVVSDLGSQLDRRHRLVESVAVQRLGGRRQSLYRFRHVLFQRYLYTRMDGAERAYAHEAVGRALERVHAGAPAVAWQLARHYEEAGLPEPAARFRRLAGEHAMRLTSAREALGHFRRGLELVAELPETPDRAALELDLQVATATPLAALEGYTSEALATAMARVRELCAAVGDPLPLRAALYHLAGYHGVRGELATATAVTRECLRLTGRLRDRAARLLGLVALGWLEVLAGRLALSRRLFRRFQTLHDPAQSRSLAEIAGYDPAIPAHGWNAWGLWLAGAYSAADEESRLATAIAEEPRQSHGQAYGIYLRVGYLRLRGNGEEMARRIEQLAVLSREEGLPFYSALAGFWSAWLAAQDGQPEGLIGMRETLAALAGAPVRAHLTALHAARAEACLAADCPGEAAEAAATGLAAAAETGERYWYPELLRLAEEARAASGDPGAGSRLQEATAEARRMGAATWELRAALSACRREGLGSRAAVLTLSEAVGCVEPSLTSADFRAARDVLAAAAVPISAARRQRSAGRRSS